MRPRHGFSVNLARHLSLSKVVTAFLFSSMPHLPDHAMFMKTCFEESGMSNSVLYFWCYIPVCKQHLSLRCKAEE